VVGRPGEEPTVATLNGQMAVFLSKTVGLQLYGAD
jgi:hypothetical protein